MDSLKQLDIYNIIIVADKKLKRDGRAFVHTISKTRKDKVVLYTPKQYEDNEARITGRQCVIFLGKNKVSEDFIPLIEIKYDKLGAVWGYDYSKAIVYIDDSVVVSRKKIINELKVLIKNIDFSNGQNLIKKNAVPILTGIFWAILFGPIAFIPGFLGVKFVLNYSIEDLQYKLGILTFLKDGLSDFIESKKTENI